MSTFGARTPRDETIHERAFTCLLAARDLGNDALVVISARVISQIRTGQSPRLGDVRAITMALREMFR
jgi:hypothetical protein